MDRIDPEDSMAHQNKPETLWAVSLDIQTGLIGDFRVSKADLRVEAYGSVDELNSVLGFARSICQNGEIDFGLWEGLSWNEIEVRDPIAAKNWAENCPNSTAPAGESFEQFQERVRREIAFLLAEVKEASVAVVTHAGFTRAVLTSLCGVSEREAWNRTEDYGSVVALDTNDIDRVEVKDSDSRDPGVWPRPRRL